VLLLLTATASTGTLLMADAFFAYTGWRLLASKDGLPRRSAGQICWFAQRKELPFALVAMASALTLALEAGSVHPRGACLAGAALVALGAHFLVYLKTACILEGLKSAQVGSADWYARGGRLEAAMVTRASLQAAAFICIIAVALS
jgi:hypothetical protein